MYNKPITSRIKHSALTLKSDEKDPKAKVYGSEKGEDKVVTKTIETPKKTLQQAYKDRGSKYKDLSFEDYSKVAKADPLYGTSGGKKEVTTTEPGEDLDYDTDLYKQKKGDVLQPWETRQMSRSIKKEQRDIRRDKIKEARANGTLTPELRKQFRAEEAKAEKEEHQSMADRAKEARATGYATGKRDTQTGQERVLKGDRTPDEQKESAKQEALKTAREDARQKAAETSNITTSSSGQAAGSIDPGSNPFSNTQFNPDDYQINYTPGTYNLGGRINEMDSPLNKGLTGKQYNLPQRLQEKIKAVPGKMKTSLKKGYFKSK